MNKKEMIDVIVSSTGMKKSDVTTALAAWIDTISNELASGNEVNITGFGKFYVVEKAQKTGRNPRTGETVVIPAHKALKFKASKPLKDLVQ